MLLVEINPVITRCDDVCRVLGGVKSPATLRETMQTEQVGREAWMVVHVLDDDVRRPPTAYVEVQLDPAAQYRRHHTVVGHGNIDRLARLQLQKEVFVARYM